MEPAGPSLDGLRLGGALLEAPRPDELQAGLDAAPFGATGHGQKLDYPWTDLTYLLHRHHVSWRYYVANGSEPDCADSQMFCRHVPQGASTPGIWNPLPRFDTVQQDHQLGNIQPLGDFYRAARKGTLAAVTWITPSQGVSEHPPALVTAGQT